MIGHKKQWEFLKKKLELNQLSHAYLFTGSDGIGKKTFGIELVKLLNCHSLTPKIQYALLKVISYFYHKVPSVLITGSAEKCTFN